MGEPMDRSGRVFLGQATKFEDAYPNIDDAVLVWEERGSGVYNFGPGTERRRASLKHIGGLLRCSNPNCRRGGFEIDVDILIDMVATDATKKSGTLVCRGDEGSPKGRRIGKRCHNMLDYTLTIKYKDNPFVAKP